VLITIKNKKMNIHEISKYLSKIGKRGGEQTLNLHGVEYFKALSKLAHKAKHEAKRAKAKIRKQIIKDKEKL